MQIESGTVLAHYRFVEPIGEGGMGQVWRATDTSLGRDVAIKLLPPALAADPERLLRLEREARVLASLNHPHIASIHGFHDVQGVRFLALELVEGPDLSQRLVQGRMPLEEAMAVARQIADALEYAHENGIVHRDLKPANVKVTPGGQVKVLDFGLAKAVVGDADGDPASPVSTPTMMPTITSGGTEKGVILGTAAYMSPEQARGKPLDRRTDIWAFGAVLYEMLSGRRAFEGETVTDVLAAVVTRDPDLDALPAETPERIRRLLGRCLEKDARRRLRDIGEARVMMEDLTATSGARPVPSLPPGAARRGPVAWLGWVAAIVFAGVAAFAFLGRGGAPDPEPLPLRKFAVPLDHADVTVGRPPAPALSPDGTSLVYALGNRLWIRDLDELHPRELPGTEAAAAPSWSPDGRWITYHVGQKILKISRDSGYPVQLGTVPTSQTLGTSASLSWDPDGDRIAIGTGTGAVLVVPTAGGEVRTLVPLAPGETDFHEVNFLPGGRGLVVVLHDPEGYGNLDLVRPDSSRVRLLDLDDPVGAAVYSSGHLVFERYGANPGLWAFPFSLDRLEKTGEAFPLVPGADHPTVSGNGDLAYLSRMGAVDGHLMWVDRAGEELATICQVAAPVRRPFPTLSDDATRALLCEVTPEGRDVFLIDLRTGVKRRLTFDPVLKDIASFLDDERILYYESGAMTTYILDPKRSSTPRRVGTGIMAQPVSGNRLVYAHLKQGGWDWNLLVGPEDDLQDDPDTLVAWTGTEWFPRVSPDERFLAFSADESGQEEIYVTTFPVSGPRWQVSVGGGANPHWTKGGRELVYTTRDAIWAVDFTAGDGTAEVGGPRRLFDRDPLAWHTVWPDGFDVTADGERFLVIRPDTADGERGAPLVIFVQNWVREFAPEP